MEPINKLIVYGTKLPSEDPDLDIYELEVGKRDLTSTHEIDLKGNNKLLELVLGDEEETTWFCDASTLHEVFPELDPALRASGNREAGEDTFVMPATLDAPATERGIIGKIAVKLLKVFARKQIDEGVESLARKLEDKHLMYGVSEDNKFLKKDYLAKGAALFSLNEKFQIQDFQQKDVKKPFLLFIHGTNSNTLGAFSKLQNSATWEIIQQVYGSNVITFQHRTLTESPLENAVKLAEMLPDNAVVHLITHSRGGLIGDVLCKYSSNGKESSGFANHHIDLLEREGDRKRDIRNIEALNKIYLEKKIRVAKYIRVACPAAGTQLASKRLDHILNVFFNLTGGIVGSVLKELISTALNKKHDAEVLPGLEAMNPGSVFLKVLNDPLEENAIDGKNLIVISGNGKVSLSGHGLLVILGKLFYWKRNDLVVNTDSMYLGVRRKNHIQYFFAQGTEVNHVKYFNNSQTTEAINLALKAAEGEMIPGFKAIPQYEIPGTDRALVDHGELHPDSFPPEGSKPIVILLPGIMGSNLTREGKEIWLHYGRILTGGLMNLRISNVDSIYADSVVRTSYYKMYKWLKRKYDVVVHPFDWRKPPPESANELNDKIKILLKLGQPIKIIGHSMGGVLVRDFIVYHNKTWEALNASRDFRMIFLGSPLGGSHRILGVLFGKDAIINKLSKLDLFNTKRGLIKMFCKFPGILSLLPLTTGPKDDFAKVETWEKMREYFGDKKWPLPSIEDLEAFRIYRDKVLNSKENIDYSNMVYVAGKDKMTPCDYYLEESNPGKQLYILFTGEGDQSVTWKLGIPKEMAAESVYYTNVTHGVLASEPDIFNGIEEILSTGKTRLLSNSKPILRGEEKIFRAEPEIDFDLSPEGLEKTILGIGEVRNPVSTRIPVSVSVSNGDLRYASYPVLAGHFAQDGILYAEKTIDTYLHGSLTSRHRLGLYPGEIGTNTFFDKMDKNDFHGAIIVGLGEADHLTSFQLTRTVEQGVLKYLLTIKGKPAPKKGIGISALIIGCGYGGVSIENSIKAIIDGVNRANEKLTVLFKEDFKTIQKIEFIELHANRALNAMYALNKIVVSESTAYNIIIGQKRIRKLLGIRKMIPLDSSEGWWNRITIKYRPENTLTKEPASMVFGASTADSREEENQLYSSTSMVDLFISQISTQNQWSACTAKTLFELLIPNALKETLKRKGNFSLILDSKTASYPWELLQDDTITAKPICINAGMIRQLSTRDYRTNIRRVAEKGALIIADPVLSDYIGQLPGARKEGQVVKDTLQSAGYPVKDLIHTQASGIITELFCRDYTIIHLAGHGIFDPESPRKSGMVIGKEVFLSVFEIQQMPVVPELVFVNCCHLGYSSSADEKFYQDRFRLAANLGTELIRIGVKAVIAAGWAVDDEAAYDFARVFYSAMFTGDNFGEAVKKARSYIYENHPGNNTWGAYQCYGEPFFKLKSDSEINVSRSPSYIVPEEAEIDLENLLNQLQMGIKINENPLEELSLIINAVDRDVFKTAEILEKQALIYQELGLYPEAIEIFENLLCEEKADFSFSCMEKYCNIRAKLYVKEIIGDPNSSSKDKIEAYNKIESVIKDLNVLLSTGATAERLNILGSSYKRLSMLAPNKAKRVKAYKMAIACYEEAYTHPKNSNRIYSLSNAIELGVLLDLSDKIKAGEGFEAEGKSYKIRTASRARKELEKRRQELKPDYDDELDYWDIVANLNIDFCLLLITEQKNIEGKWKEMEDSYNHIWEKAGSPGKKAAELEHLQFVTYALRMAAGTGDTTKPPSKGIFDITHSDLVEHINELKIALNAVRKKGERLK